MSSVLDKCLFYSEEEEKCLYEIETRDLFKNIALIRTFICDKMDIGVKLRDELYDIMNVIRDEGKNFILNKFKSVIFMKGAGLLEIKNIDSISDKHVVFHIPTYNKLKVEEQKSEWGIGYFCGIMLIMVVTFVLFKK